MKLFAITCLFLIISQSVFAMPCDTGYHCISKTGKYNILLQRCRYRNHLNLLSTKISGIEIPSAVLNEGWDGDSFLAFEINIPTLDTSAVRILSAELSAKHKIGIIKEKTAVSEPGPLSVVYSEKIKCTIEE